MNINPVIRYGIHFIKPFYLTKEALVRGSAFIINSAIPIAFGTTIFFTKIFTDLLIGDLVYNTAGILLIACLAAFSTAITQCISLISRVTTIEYSVHMARVLPFDSERGNSEFTMAEESESSSLNRTSRACILFATEVLKAVFYGSLATLFHKAGLLSDKMTNLSQFCLADWIMNKTPVTKYISTNLKSLSFTNVLPAVQTIIFWGHNIMHWTGYIAPLKHLFLAPAGCKLSKAMEQYFANLEELPLANPLVFATSSAINRLPARYSDTINDFIKGVFERAKSHAVNFTQGHITHSTAIAEDTESELILP